MTATIDEMRRSLARFAKMLEELAARRDYDRSAESDSGPGSDVFDYGNRMHRLAVQEHFERLKINEKRQGWFLNRGLIGVRLRDLAAHIEAENDEYVKRWGAVKPFRVARRDGARSNWDGEGRR